MPTIITRGAGSAKGFGFASSASPYVFRGFQTPAYMGTPTGFFMGGIVCNAAGLFVAVGYDLGGAPQYATSINGSNWTTPSLMNGSSAVARMKSVAINSSGLFVAVGYNSSNFPVYATSSNGSTWTTPALMNGSSAVALMQSITVDSTGLFMAVGYDSTSSSVYPVYATSSNGSTWTTPARIGTAIISVGMGVAVNSSGRFVMVGYQFNSGAATYAYSSNGGATWSAIARMAGVTTFGNNIFKVAVSSSGTWTAIGYSQTNNSAIYANSTNGGINWTAPAAIPVSSGTCEMNGLTVSPSNVFMAVGNTGSGAVNPTGYPAYTTATTGSNWTTVTTMNNSTTTAYMQAVAVNSAGQYSAVGYNSSTYGVGVLSN